MVCLASIKDKKVTARSEQLGSAQSLGTSPSRASPFPLTLAVGGGGLLKG